MADAAGQAGVLASLLNSAPTMCDNDKYSSMLAMATLPQAQRDMMAANFRVQEQNIAEAMRTIDAELEPEQFRRFLNIHTQNLNRFFKLSPHHADFADPFASTINLLNVPALSADFDDAELVAVVAEFYFKLGYYDDAFDMFSRLDTIAAPDAARYQKMGYCMEKTSAPAEPPTSTAEPRYSTPNRCGPCAAWPLCCAPTAKPTKPSKPTAAWPKSSPTTPARPSFLATA